MKTSSLSFRELNLPDMGEMVSLGKQLNPNKTEDELGGYILEMFQFANYHGWGLFLDGKMIGFSSGWVSVRLYCGKQLEIDNVIIDNDFRSSGFGKVFLGFIEAWAKENQCTTIELNTYVQNARSHKFYFNLGYSILAFHFQKKI